MLCKLRDFIICMISVIEILKNHLYDSVINVYSNELLDVGYNFLRMIYDEQETE